MITTKIHKGQGLGNQLFCYVVTRTIALDKGYEFGIQSPYNLKCLDFLNLDFGQKLDDGRESINGVSTKLPPVIKNYYKEKRILHPITGADISTFDEHLMEIEDDTMIEGVMQDENYFVHRKNEIKEWLKVKKESECLDYSNENICVVNFRGGEYVRFPELFLNQKYWDDAIKNIRNINPNMKFIVVTDDTHTAKKIFPDFKITHKSVGNDYSIINNAHYLILSNSSFAFFPTWLNEKVKLVIAPKYWARHNVSDGYWSLSQNIVRGWTYQDRAGVLHDYDTCIKEYDEYKTYHPNYFAIKNDQEVKLKWINPLLFIKKIIGASLSQKTKNTIYYFFKK